MTIQEIEQKLNECQKALAELKESKKEGKWKPSQDEVYFYRGDNGITTKRYYADNQYDEWRYNNIPLFKTEKECERYCHFMDTVKEKSYEFSEEEWTKFNCAKWYIRKIDKRICVDCLFSENCYGAIYFKTKEDAQYIIDNFKEELMEYFI